MTTYLLDASLYVFRAYHSRAPEWTDPEGWPTHAVHGFTSTLLALLEQTKTDRLVVCFDESLGSGFRYQLYPKYKANREPPPTELVRQFAYCKQVVQALGFTALGHAEFEADDLIASLVQKLKHADQAGVIVSADKDLAQLLGGKITQWDFGKSTPFGPAAVRERYGVEPEQMAQMQALSGDSVDNIPGISGFGLKTAAALISHFGSLEATLSRYQEVEFLRIRGAKTAALKLREQAHSARLSLQLTQLASHAPVPELTSLTRQPRNPKQIDALFDQLGFGGYLRARAKRL